MKKTFYEKIGKRYVPVKEYDSDFLDALPLGNHLIMSRPGKKSVKYNIDPNYASLIAAGSIAQDAICNAMLKASELKPSKQPITQEQKIAWENLAKSFGQEMYTLNGVGVNEIVQAGIESMQQEAEKLMKHTSVQEAYDHFITMVKLCSDYQEKN